MLRCYRGFHRLNFGDPSGNGAAALAQIQMHSVREENPLVHGAERRADPERNFRLPQNVALQIDTRRNLDIRAPQDDQSQEYRTCLRPRSGEAWSDFSDDQFARSAARSHAAWHPDNRDRSMN